MILKKTIFAGLLTLPTCTNSWAIPVGFDFTASSLRIDSALNIQFLPRNNLNVNLPVGIDLTTSSVQSLLQDNPTISGRVGYDTEEYFQLSPVLSLYTSPQLEFNFVDASGQQTRDISTITAFGSALDNIETTDPINGEAQLIDFLSIGANFEEPLFSAPVLSPTNFPQNYATEDLLAGFLTLNLPDTYIPTLEELVLRLDFTEDVFTRYSINLSGNSFFDVTEEGPIQSGLLPDTFTLDTFDSYQLSMRFQTPLEFAVNRQDYSSDTAYLAAQSWVTNNIDSIGFSESPHWQFDTAKSVPLPASIWLMIIGLITLSRLTRRRKSYA